MCSWLHLLPRYGEEDVHANAGKIGIDRNRFGVGNKTKGVCFSVYTQLSSFFLHISWQYLAS